MRESRKNVLHFNSWGAISIVLMVVMLVISFAGCSDDSDNEQEAELGKQTSDIQEQGDQLKDTPTPSPTKSPTQTQQKFITPKMVSIPGGSFQMGDLSGDGYIDELPVHTVTISPFSMAKYEVSYAEWVLVRDWAEAHGYDFDNEGNAGNKGLGDENHPVTAVNWYDAVKWCNALSEMEGRTPCYYTSAAQSMVYRFGGINIESDWVKGEVDGYRLPTEAEWEYACRAGHSTKYAFGDSIDGGDANFWNSGDRYDNGTTPVGYCHANDYGLYDMHGNVWEWCFDWYGGEYYKESPSNDPEGPSVGLHRVSRGGAWTWETDNLRATIRRMLPPDGGGDYDLGFRLVRSS